MTKSVFEKAIDRTHRIDAYLNNRDWDTFDEDRLDEVQIKVRKIQCDAIDIEIERLKRYGKECQQTINDDVYTSPFIPGGQQHISVGKREQQKTRTELAKITEAINDLRSLWLDILGGE